MATQFRAHGFSFPVASITFVLLLISSNKILLSTFVYSISHSFIIIVFQLMKDLPPITKIKCIYTLFFALFLICLHFARLIIDVFYVLQPLLGFPLQMSYLITIVTCQTSKTIPTNDSLASIALSSFLLSFSLALDLEVKEIINASPVEKSRARIVKIFLCLKIACDILFILRL